MRYPPAKRGKIILWGLLARFPFGGLTWQVLHHLVALRRLGFDVWYVTDSENMVGDPATYSRTPDYLPNVRYLSRQMESIGLGDRWIFRPPGSRDVCLGSDVSGLARLYREADAVFDLCAAQEIGTEHSAIRCLVGLQTDPGADQAEVAKGNPERIKQLDAYDFLFTYGQNLGAPDCPLPAVRYRWIPTRPPVYLDWWRTAELPPSGGPLTTVANWKRNSKHNLVWNGETYHARKDLAFLQLIELPELAALPLELALIGISDDQITRMRKHGWRMVSAEDMSEALTYRSYIQRSLGEFTVVNEQYARLRVGWFSDRSVCYLAAGRPVIMQDTGFGKSLPTGEGLFFFATKEEALAAISEVAHDYARHSAAARAIADAYFSAERVLGDVLRTIGLL